MLARVFHISTINKVKIFVSLLLSFQAGAINTGAYIICHRFVSHVTGFATLFGIEFSQMNFIAAINVVTVPLFFLAGVMISAYFVDMRIAANKKPQYTFLIMSITFLMLLASFGGYLGWFGSVNTPITANPDYPLIAILCLACGIQNASITSASGAVIRTTHLTGITTDLGLGLMRILAQSQSEKIKQAETRSTFIRVGIIGAFILGSTISAYLFYSKGFLGFLIPAGISAALLIWDLLDRMIHTAGAKKHG